MEPLMNDIKVKDVMTHLVVTVRPQDTIQEAARQLLNNCISGAPVVEGGRLTGVISEADLVAAYAPPARSGSYFVATDSGMFSLRGTVPIDAHRTTVAEIMTKDVVSVAPDTSIWTAASLMDRQGVRRLPVVGSHGSVVGVLARADLVRAMVLTDVDVASAVRKAIEIMGAENFTSLEVEASDGSVTISGNADRKTTHDLAVGIASHVSGVLEVVDELEWEWDDSDVKPVRTPRDLSDVGRDPRAVGALVKDATG
jgi:CBS-domain-containing membrane protein